jgi:hypothetical protein
VSLAYIGHGVTPPDEYALHGPSTIQTHQTRPSRRSASPIVSFSARNERVAIGLTIRF